MDPLAPPLRRRPFRYAFHILSGLAMTSLALHIINQRDAHRSDRLHLATKTTILEELTGRIRSGDPSLTLDEVNKVMKLAETHTLGAPPSDAEKPQETTSWRDTIFGKKRDPRKDEQELEDAKKIWEEALSESPKKLTIASEAQAPPPGLGSAITSYPQSSLPVTTQAPKKSEKAVFY
ncbi:hypothetical protein M407DRAFT_166678 [Tulasnella calospora MUT 4182]|uniref:Uncharacterized protein n=1 Tax=Tulasnella calospora MUT 4182 TaxID=1051891 RepID=A0A0C3QW92_9AGAM|nr:hypothetical protein M407DRAFT_166678 [Tulasnella calospora MUT 4182]